MDESGVIKFSCDWILADPPGDTFVHRLNSTRSELFRRGLIGVYPNGIAYGNISVREQENRFVITGTATGGLPVLESTHYTTVTSFDLEKNRVVTQGPVIASSESMTHACIYAEDTSINAVVHVHHAELWKRLQGAVPTTKAAVEYGTPAMGMEIRRLFRETDIRGHKILVMAGHEDGIITFGKDLAEATQVLFSYTEN